MSRLYSPLLWIILLIASLGLKAQQLKPSYPGSAKGIIRDSTHNHALRSATVSIYRSSDSTLLSYQITNTYGEFNFRNLPVAIPLFLQASHVGYQNSSRKFSIQPGVNTIDLKSVIINPKDINLTEVVVSVPPITMNGDTLEFNAAAFKLDSNAVVEDLLRKIPNITLWGDGLITVNGREVKSILVNGKPFFGGSANIAIQNIPKSSITKVQVYNSADRKSNPRDSILTMNLKLKKDKETGLFGKFALGYGTSRRYEAEVSLNFFTPKMQLAAVGANNNLNKPLHDVNTLIENSTFKGLGTNVEYQPDFRYPGIVSSRATGLRLNYNFIEKPLWNSKSALSADYFMQNRNSVFTSDLETTTSIGDAEKIYERSNNQALSNQLTHRSSSSYELVKKRTNLTINYDYSKSKGDNNNINLREALNNQMIPTSKNESVSYSQFDKSNFSLKADFRSTEDFMNPKSLLKGISISYLVRTINERNRSDNQTAFTSYLNPVENQLFDRKYNTTINSIEHESELTLPNFESLFTGKKEFLGVKFDLTNSLKIQNEKHENQISDRNPLGDEYTENTYLTNFYKTSFLEESPGLSISKTFSKNLSNRYHKSMIITFHPKGKLIFQDNISQRAFQNIKRQYNIITPDASLSYSNFQYGQYYQSYLLSYATKIAVPTLEQLAPLLDSTNLYYLRLGNPNLRRALEREIRLQINHSDQRNRNTLNYSINAVLSFTDDQIIDSTFIDQQNKRLVYLTNANGYRMLSFLGAIHKAIKFKKSELQLVFNVQLSLNKSPGYINNLFAFSENMNSTLKLTANYTLNRYLAVALAQTYSPYSSKQVNLDTKYTGANMVSTLSSRLNLTKKLSINTNLNLNRSTASNTVPINFTIWNASTAYRFLKGNNGELKISALDLLRQNTSVINYGRANSFSVGTQNVLQQYFLVTLLYFPRYFGK